MSESVLADAQFTLARTLRPFTGFEDVYQGQAAEIPIAFPGTLDANAGQPGFDPNLIAGIPVPYGSKLVLWIPSVFNSVGEGAVVPVPYAYSLVWRLRNVRDFRADRAAYHFPRETEGEASEFVLPAALHGILYQGPQESRPVGVTTDTYAAQTFTREQFIIQSVVPRSVLTPAGNVGSYQQGLSGSLSGTNNVATWNPIQVDCMGDELIILVNPTDLSRTWNFNSAEVDDRGFSSTYGTDNGARPPIRDMGIFVFTGSNP